MRTTLTLDDEVVTGLRQLRELNPERSFKQIVNQVIKKGLLASGQKPNVPFKIEPINAVPRKGINFDNIGRLIEIAEGDAHK